MNGARPDPKNAATSSILDIKQPLVAFSPRVNVGSGDVDGHMSATPEERLPINTMI
jgi:hypothetical protein